MYLVLNLLSVKEIDVWRVCSILGYGDALDDDDDEVDASASTTPSSRLPP